MTKFISNNILYYTVKQQQEIKYIHICIIIELGQKNSIRIKSCFIVFITIYITLDFGGHSPSFFYIFLCAVAGVVASHGLATVSWVQQPVRLDFSPQQNHCCLAGAAVKSWESTQAYSVGLCSQQRWQWQSHVLESQMEYDWRSQNCIFFVCLI